jgi:hypothetical protein
MDEEDEEIAHSLSYQLSNLMNSNVFWISPGTGLEDTYKFPPDMFT